MRVPTVSLRHEEEIIVAGSSRKTSWFIYFYISMYIFSIFTTFSFFWGGAHHNCWLVKIVFYLGFILAQPMCITGVGGSSWECTFTWNFCLNQDLRYFTCRGSNEVPTLLLTRVGGVYTHWWLCTALDLLHALDDAQSIFGEIAFPWICSHLACL